MNEVQDKLFSAMIKVLRDYDVSPLDGIECVINATASLIYSTGAVLYGFETEEEKDGFVIETFQQAIDQIKNK